MMEIPDLEDKTREGSGLCHKRALGSQAISMKRNVLFAPFSVVKTFGLHQTAEWERI